jgi:tetratricopeptide (TPR) repeat protein
MRSGACSDDPSDTVAGKGPAVSGPHIHRVERGAWLFGHDRTARTRRLLLLLLFPALTLASTLRFDFVFDDNLVFFEDPLIVGPFNLGRILGSQVKVVDVVLGYYRPLITLLYHVDWTLWGFNPAGYHLTNLLWHLLATVLVYRVALRTTGRVAAAWAGAMLFAVLPPHAEAIGWIQGRVDLVSTTFVLLALLALLRAREAGGRTGWGWASLAGLAFLGALLSKESVAALPLAWAVWEVSTIGRGGWRERLAEAAPRFASLAFAMLVYWTLRHAAVGALVSFPMSIFPVGHRLLALLTVHGEYAWTLLIPSVALNFHVGLPAHPTPTSVLIGLMMASLLGGGLVATWRCARPLFPWIAWIPIMLLPPLLFTLYAPAPLVGYYTAERFLYLPSAGWCVLLGFLFAHLLDASENLGRAAWGLVTFGCMLVGYAGLLLVRLLPWGDAVDLYLAMKAQPRMSEAIRIFVLNDLGRVYLERGEFVPARDEFQAALRLKPDYAAAHNNMGVLLIRQGKPAEALRWLEAAIRLDSASGNSYGNLGAAFEALGDLGTARRVYEAGLRAAPSSAWLAKGLARVTADGEPRQVPKTEISR